MEYSYIGKIASTHGLDGSLILHHRLAGKNTVLRLKHIFLELNRESYIPYFIEEMKVLNEEEVRLRLDEIDTKEKAKELSGKSVYIEVERFREMNPKAIDAGLEGFLIVDYQLGNLGKIESLMETPGQVLAVIHYKEKEVLIPLIEATIKSIDSMQQTIFVALPDGLLDIYL